MTITVKSKTTGQVLFSITELSGELSLSPLEARRLLCTLGDSSIGHFVHIASDDARHSTPAACMRGVTASFHPDVELEPINFHPQIRKRVIIA